MIPMENETPDHACTRRELLYRGGLIAATLGISPALLAACGGTTTTASQSASATPTTIAGTTRFFSWQGYDLLDIAAMKTWRKANDVQLKSTYISNHNEITAKFTTGGGKGLYNLSTCFHGYSRYYASLKIPSTLDMSRIPNFQKAYEVFRSGPTFDRWWNIDGQQMLAPFTWGLQGVNYDAAKTKPPASYLDLLKPEYKGKIGITDDILSTMVIGAHAVGVFRYDSLYTTEQVAKVMAFWTAMKKNARLIVPSYGNMADQFQAGEITVGVPGWAAVNAFAGAKGYNSVKHTIPKEGANSFVDGYMIPSGAPEIDTAYAYINEALTPEVQAQTAEYLVQACVVPEALSLMSQDSQDLYPYAQISEMLTTNSPLAAVPVVVPSGYADYAYWNQAWETFKAA
jgi:spermidine/putrescine transport system substrate-binding protein